MDLDEAKQILAAFERGNVQYVLVGSMAMAARSGSVWRRQQCSTV
jgi:hypothetical protein